MQHLRPLVHPGEGEGAHTRLLVHLVRDGFDPPDGLLASVRHNKTVVDDLATQNRELGLRKNPRSQAVFRVDVPCLRRREDREPRHLHLRFLRRPGALLARHHGPLVDGRPGPRKVRDPRRNLPDAQGPAQRGQEVAAILFQQVVLRAGPCAGQLLDGLVDLFRRQCAHRHVDARSVLVHRAQLRRVREHTGAVLAETEAPLRSEHLDAGVEGASPASLQGLVEVVRRDAGADVVDV
mmetsp:Transcript_47212/g.137338  ORF Transcript_47212/g.137338 Transcript_47212/m.137338 type:complete len:237 (-) Transcript_47212:336-1046(-)